MEEITPEAIKRELETIATTSIEEIVERMADGKMRLRENVSKEKLGAIQSIEVESNGNITKIKLHSKFAALKTLKQIKD
jgi:hypothetical protein